MHPAALPYPLLVGLERAARARPESTYTRRTADGHRPLTMSS